MIGWECRPIFYRCPDKLPVIMDLPRVTKRMSAKWRKHSYDELPRWPVTVVIIASIVPFKLYWPLAGHFSFFPLSLSFSPSISLTPPSPRYPHIPLATNATQTEMHMLRLTHTVLEQQTDSSLRLLKMSSIPCDLLIYSVPTPLSFH